MPSHPNRPGTFHAWVMGMSIAPSRASNLPTVYLELYLAQEVFALDNIVNCDNEQMAIRANFTLVNKNGALNDINVEQMRDALDWPGDDFKWFNTDPLPNDFTVQIDLGPNDYKPEQYPFKVTAIRRTGSDPSARQQTAAGDDQLAQWNAQFGGALRAKAGNTPAPAPPPTGQPTPPAATPAPVAAPPAQEQAPPQAAPAAAPPAQEQAPEQATPPPPPDAVPSSTMNDAWAAITAKMEGVAQEDQHKIWFDTLQDLFPDRDFTQQATLQAMTPTEWGRVATEGPGRVPPF